MILCPKCGKIANWFSYFKDFLCDYCNWRGKEPPYKSENSITDEVFQGRSYIEEMSRIEFDQYISSELRRHSIDSYDLRSALGILLSALKEDSEKLAIFCNDVKNQEAADEYIKVMPKLFEAQNLARIVYEKTKQHLEGK